MYGSRSTAKPVSPYSSRPSSPVSSRSGSRPGTPVDLGNVSFYLEEGNLKDVSPAVLDAQTRSQLGIVVKSIKDNEEKELPREGCGTRVKERVRQLGAYVSSSASYVAGGVVSTAYSALNIATMPINYALGKMPFIQTSVNTMVSYLPERVTNVFKHGARITSDYMLNNIVGLVLDTVNAVVEYTEFDPLKGYDTTKNILDKMSKAIAVTAMWYGGALPYVAFRELVQAVYSQIKNPEDIRIEELKSKKEELTKDESEELAALNSNVKKRADLFSAALDASLVLSKQYVKGLDDVIQELPEDSPFYDKINPFLDVKHVHARRLLQDQSQVFTVNCADYVSVPVDSLQIGAVGPTLSTIDTPSVFFNQTQSLIREITRNSDVSVVFQNCNEESVTNSLVVQIVAAVKAIIPEEQYESFLPTIKARLGLGVTINPAVGQGSFELSCAQGAGNQDCVRITRDNGNVPLTQDLYRDTAIGYILAKYPNAQVVIGDGCKNIPETDKLVESLARDLSALGQKSCQVIFDENPSLFPGYTIAPLPTVPTTTPSPSPSSNGTDSVVGAPVLPANSTGSSSDNTAAIVGGSVGGAAGVGIIGGVAKAVAGRKGATVAPAAIGIDAGSTGL